FGLTVTPVEDAPVAVDNSAMINEDTPLSVPAPGVLGNDTDPDAGDVLRALLINGPSNAATFNLKSNGAFAYIPKPNFNGKDSFIYKASDGTLESNVATVTIVVNPVNDPPVAADDNYTIDEDTPLKVATPGVLSNDSDVD